jgi:menaquinone-dependent protoporphyrinogen IX oxidase
VGWVVLSKVVLRVRPQKQLPIEAEKRDTTDGIPGCTNYLMIANAIENHHWHQLFYSLLRVHHQLFYSRQYVVLSVRNQKEKNKPSQKKAILYCDHIPDYLQR